MLDTGFLGGVGKSLSNGNLVAVKRGVDKGKLSTTEEIVDEVVVYTNAGEGAVLGDVLVFLCWLVSGVELTDDAGYVWIRSHFGGNDALLVAQLGANMVANGSSHSDEGGSLATTGVYNGNGLVRIRHEALGWAKGQGIIS